MQIDINILLAFIEANENHIVKILNDDICRNGLNFRLKKYGKIEVYEDTHTIKINFPTYIFNDPNSVYFVLQSDLSVHNSTFMSKQIKRLFTISSIIN